jgi:hypothetical protein
MNSSITLDPDTIRHRAYTHWQQRACPEGSAEHDWFAAEQELLKERVEAALAAAGSMLVSVAGSSAPEAVVQEAAQSTKTERPTHEHASKSRSAKPRKADPAPKAVLAMRAPKVPTAVTTTRRRAARSA